MTAPTNTWITTNIVGEVESVEDVIYNIAPTDAPFLTSIESTTAKQTLHEWQTDSLTAAATNYALEGDNPDATANTATTRLSNTCQISDFLARVSGTARAVQLYGREDELDYQVVKFTKQLRRDMEFGLLDNNAEVTTDSPRETGGLEAWLATNTSHGTGGSAGSAGNTARTTGTDRQLTEALVKTQLANIWTAGGDPDLILVPGTIKQRFSEFTGNATRMINAQDKELVATIDVYASDFGDLQVMPDRFMETDSCLILQKSLWKIAYLRRPSAWAVAKLGDNDAKQILTEFALESCNEAGSGAVFDVTA